MARHAARCGASWLSGKFEGAVSVKIAAIGSAGPTVAGEAERDVRLAVDGEGDSRLQREVLVRRPEAMGVTQGRWFVAVAGDG